MSPMDKHELRRSILCIVGCLLCADMVQIPDMDSAIFRGRGEMKWRMRGPGELRDCAMVAFEGVEFSVKVTDIP